MDTQSSLWLVELLAAPLALKDLADCFWHPIALGRMELVIHGGLVELMAATIALKDAAACFWLLQLL